jgi:FAD/FMN-containing dehydrogenase
VKEILKTSKKVIGENLTAIEFFDSESNKIVSKNLDYSNPLGYSNNFYVLVESSEFTSSDNSSTDSKLFSLFEAASSSIADGVIAQDSSQFSSIWRLRESVIEAFLKEGKTFKYDFSLPIDHFSTFIAEVRQKAEKYARTGGYGHVGDGNVHVSLVVMCRLMCQSVGMTIWKDIRRQRNS